MSWHSCAIMIHADRSGDIVGLLDEIGFPGAHRVGSTSFDEATSISIFGEFGDGPGAAVATIDGWTSIWGPILYGDTDALARISRDADVFTLLLEGASGS